MTISTSRKDFSFSSNWRSNKQRQLNLFSHLVVRPLPPTQLAFFLLLFLSDHNQANTQSNRWRTFGKTENKEDIQMPIRRNNVERAKYVWNVLVDVETSLNRSVINSVDQTIDCLSWARVISQDLFYIKISVIDCRKAISVSGKFKCGLGKW